MKHQLRRHLRAMTLVEIMVVIAIIGILAVVMLSAVKYQYRNRSVKEGERQLNAFIGAAQARAQQLGRPVGIWIERFSKEAPAPIVGANPTLNQILPIGANYAVQVYQAEVPRPYTGDLRDSRVTVSNNGTHWAINFPPASALRNENNPLIRAGERFKIQFDHRGPFHEAVRSGNLAAAEYILMLDTVNTGGQIPKGAMTSSGVPYTVHRRPVRSLTAPLRLPPPPCIPRARRVPRALPLKVRLAEGGLLAAAAAHRVGAATSAAQTTNRGVAEQLLRPREPDWLG